MKINECSKGREDLAIQINQAHSALNAKADYYYLEVVKSGNSTRDRKLLGDVGGNTRKIERKNILKLRVDMSDTKMSNHVKSEDRAGM